MQRVHRRRPAGARRAAVTLPLLFLACALLGAVLPQAAGATAMGFSFTPSKTEPYAVCGRATPGHSACLAILVPSAPLSSVSAEPQAASPALRSTSLTGSGVGGGYSPADLRLAYGLPSESAGSGQTVAIVDAYDDPDAESDLGVYRSRYGISACTTANGCFKKVNQSGGNTYPANEPGWAVEISLDLDMVSAACPNCHILLVEATNNENANLFKAEDEAATLGATEISNSWGGPESSGDASEDTYFHHAGVPVTASAGDSGYEVEYPAASQYVIAVGGTALTQASNSRGWSETAWAGTGSGCSAYEAKPAWQTDAGCSHRTNNDVAAVASPETPVSFADSYKLPAEFSQPEPGWSLVGGTSVSSPLIAGTMALANAYTRSLPGAEALYTEATQNGTGTLDDVTSGSNGSCGTYLCNGVSGYDGPTGLGSPYGAPVALPSAPAVVTTTASSLTETTATLTATVNPNGGEVTGCELEYGTTTSYGSSATCTRSPGSGSSPVSVSAAVSGLSANTTYHFRISATNAGGTSRGSDETFKTTAPSATAPAPETKASSSITQTSASLNASVNPDGATVSKCEFEYGTTTAYGSSTACSSLPGSGSSPVAVSVSVSGLTANTTYHFRISATNAGGTSKGSDASFKTLPDVPAVVTTAASSLTQTTATIAATVNPNGGEVTGCELEYGTTTSYGSSAPCSSLPGSGSSPVAVSASLTGLSANTTYHFRISATNAGGTSKGADEAFRTLPNEPAVVTDPASSLAQTTATLTATVNPNGGEVTGCELEYGTTISYGSSAPCASLPGSGSSPVAVSASLTGLSANTTYHFRISATNAGGTSKGSDETFKTLPDAPAIVTGAASSITQTAVTLNAAVNPGGGAVSKCEFEYGTTTSYGSSAPCSSLPGSGSSPVAVSASLTGLTANTTYHFRISATNAGGTSKGADEAFKTVAAAMTPPTVVTEAASSITQTSAALNATVNPHGGTVSMCEFEYGTSTSYGSSAPCSVQPGASSPVEVVVSIEGLAAATTYYFRIVAANQGGTSAGVGQTLTTLLPATLPQQGSGVQEVLSAPVVPPSLQPQQQTAPAPPVPDAKLATTSLEVSLSGKVAIGVSCPAAESSCTGTIVLRTLTAVSTGVTGHQSKKPKAAILTLADGSFTVAGGKVRALTLRLSARARTLLARTRVLRVRATIVAHDRAGGAHTTQTLVTLRLRKATRH